MVTQIILNISITTYKFGNMFNYTNSNKLYFSRILGVALLILNLEFLNKNLFVLYNF